MIAVPFGDLKREYQYLQMEIDAAIKRVLERGWFITGEEGRAFETEWAAFCGCEQAVAVGNGTDAICIALQACGIGAGDEVITVPLTAVPTVTGISMAGALPRFVDVQEVDGLMDVSQLAQAITAKTKAIVPVHLYGGACQMDAILELAHKHDLLVIEDAAQAHGCTFAGKQVGTFGNAGCFSFYPSKNLGAYGDAGAVVTNDERVAAACRMARDYGQDRRYHHVVAGVNSRMDEIQAAILRTKLPFLRTWNQRRLQIAAAYDAAVAECGKIRPMARIEGHVCHLYVLTCSDRDELQSFLAERGIGTQIHYPYPVHMQPAYAHLRLGEGSFPVAEKLARSIISLPIYPLLSDAEVEMVCSALRQYCCEQ